MPDGEVAVRQAGHEHAVETPGLDGQVFVNLDREVPHLEVPSDVDVSFHDEDELETDGGEAASRSVIQMRGAGLGEDGATLALVLGTFLLFGGGTLFSSGSGILAALTGLAGAFCIHVGGHSFYRSDRT